MDKLQHCMETLPILKLKKRSLLLPQVHTRPQNGSKHYHVVSCQKKANCNMVPLQRCKDTRFICNIFSQKRKLHSATWRLDKSKSTRFTCTISPQKCKLQHGAFTQVKTPGSFAQSPLKHANCNTVPFTKIRHQVHLSTWLRDKSKNTLTH